jgi:hypothetical protein
VRTRSLIFAPELKNEIRKLTVSCTEGAEFTLMRPQSFAAREYSTFSRKKKTEPWSGLRQWVSCTPLQLWSQSFFKSTQANTLSSTSVREK